MRLVADLVAIGGALCVGYFIGKAVQRFEYDMDDIFNPKNSYTI